MIGARINLKCFARPVAGDLPLKRLEGALTIVGDFPGYSAWLGILSPVKFVGLASKLCGSKCGGQRQLEKAPANRHLFMYSGGEGGGRNRDASADTACHLRK